MIKNITVNEVLYYYVLCDICKVTTSPRSQYKAQAVARAYDNGWYLSPTHWHCPYCIKVVVNPMRDLLRKRRENVMCQAADSLNVGLQNMVSEPPMTKALPTYEELVRQTLELQEHIAKLQAYEVTIRRLALAMTNLYNTKIQVSEEKEKLSRTVTPITLAELSLSSALIQAAELEVRSAKDGIKRLAIDMMRQMRFGDR